MDLPLEIKAAPKAASEASRGVRNAGPDRNKERRCQDVLMKPALPGALPTGTRVHRSQRDVWDETLSLPPWHSIFRGWGSLFCFALFFFFLFILGKIFF